MKKILAFSILAISIVLSGAGWLLAQNPNAMFGLMFLTSTVQEKSNDYTITNFDDRTVIYMSGVQKTLTLNAPATYTSSLMAIGVCNTNTLNANTISANGVSQRIYPGQCKTLKKPSSGTAWVWWPQKQEPYQTFGAVLYVSTSGTDNNDGLTLATPLRLINTALTRLCTDFNSQGRNVQIQLADGTYVENVGRFGQCPNVGDGLSLVGNLGDNTKVRILGANPADTTVQARDMGILFISHISVGCTQGTANGVAVSASQWGVIDFDDSIIIGCDNGIAFDVQDGGSLNVGTAIISSNTLRVARVLGGSSRMILAGTITCDGIISAVNQFIYVAEHAYADVSQVSSWPGCGPFVGQSYYVEKNSRLIGAASVPGTTGFVDGQTFGSIDGTYPVTSWTPTDASGAGLAFVSTVAVVQRSGHLCTVSFTIQYPVTANGSPALIGGLPCTSTAGGVHYFGSQVGGVAGSVPRVTNNDTRMDLLDVATVAQITNAAMSGKTIRGTVTFSAQ